MGADGDGGAAGIGAAADAAGACRPIQGTKVAMDEEARAYPSAGTDGEEEEEAEEEAEEGAEAAAVQVADVDAAAGDEAAPAGD